MTVSKYTKIIVLTSWIPICLIYYHNFNIGYSLASKTFFVMTGKGLVNLNKTYTYKYKGTENYLINTPGCYIPNYGKSLKFKEATLINRTCGVRAVFVKTIDKTRIQLNIDKAKMNAYSHGKTYYCCVSFAAPKNVSGKINLTKLQYSSCNTFRNGSIVHLEQEIVTVSCYAKSTRIYEDAYIILKKLNTVVNPAKSETNSWNILVLGIDTMSRARLMSSMPRTAQYLRDHNWLDFRGYQKVGYNTFPNVMSLLTGKNISTMYKACGKGLEECSKYLLWNKFKEAGYITAYGEDYLSLPDTFSRYNGFQSSPTDHYMRPFFLTGETVTGNLVCTKRITSINHILSYAYQFSNAYQKQKFYGLFWINSCSHNERNNPSIYDKDFVAFFDKLNNDGILDNTFLIFISDHGIRYGSNRIPVESYYEERLPMFQLWVPKKFRELYPDTYRNLQINQGRLVTPYDLYLTMVGILKNSQRSNEITTSEACPLCKSLFEEMSSHRTCYDTGVNEKWCSCHNMVPVDSNKQDVIRSMQVITEQLEKRASKTKTTTCTECHKFKLSATLRSHTYNDTVQNNTYYVIAFFVNPGRIGYEAVVQKQSNQFSLVPFMDSITPYNPKGYCVLNPVDRGYCVCKNICKKKVDKSKRNINKENKKV